MQTSDATVSELKLVVTAVVAFTGDMPSVGDAVVVSAAGLLIAAKFRGITPQSTSASGESSPAPQWTRMAAIEIEHSQFLPPATAGQSQAIDLLDPTSHQPIASGIAIDRIRPGEHPASQSFPGLTIWLTGLSGAGKTTLARALAPTLSTDFRVEVLDGDVVRTHICKGLGFSREDRQENVRRLACLAKLFTQTGAVAVVSAISPYRTMREEARRIVGNFLEVYVNAPLEVCEQRDAKGLYKRARRGELRSFTGIDDPYEAPIDPEVECRTDLETVTESVARIRSAVMVTSGRNLPPPGILGPMAR